MHTPNTIAYLCELTDTFGGEPNYSWLRRALIRVPPRAPQHLIVRRAKAALGITGERCATSPYGDGYELRPQGSCTVAFISYMDAQDAADYEADQE